MPVIDVQHDAEGRCLTITAEFAAPIERVWAIYADPRQLEQVWGPPTHPATFVDHTLTPGSRSTYYMTGPDGEKYYGLWQITDVDEPNGFSFEDSFADSDFTPNPDLPASQNTTTFHPAGGGTRAVFTSRYATAEALQQVLDMGAVEGATLAINQIDGLLAA